MAGKHEVLSDEYVSYRSRLCRWIVSGFGVMCVALVLLGIVKELIGMGGAADYFLYGLVSLAIMILYWSRHDSLLENKRLLDRDRTT
jgi:hypothetical protein